MDALTQGLLGAAASQGLFAKKIGNRAGIVGFVAGAAPDLDILIRSSTDPLLSLEFHRHFTHSLLFIPVGGLLIAGLFWLFWRRNMRFTPLFFAATAAWATHGLLDVLTSYGTHWLWPFSKSRLAWDWIGIIDLFVTLPLLVGLIVAMRKRSARPATIGLAFAMVYLVFGALQHYRAATVQEQVAQARGHQITRSRVIPSPLTLSLWRSIYESQGQLWADAIHVGPFSTTGIWPGGSVPRKKADDMQTTLAPQSQQMNDVRRFERFSQGYMYCAEKEYCLVMGDFRYAQLPNGLEPLWGIRLFPNTPKDQHVERVRFTEGFSDRLPLFLDMLKNTAPGLISVENLSSHPSIQPNLANQPQDTLGTS